MPNKAVSELHALLLAQREQLLGEVRARISASGDSLGFANQSKLTDDDAAADAAAAMDVTMVIRESQELQDVEAALARIGDGSYGNCADCGDDIALALSAGAKDAALLSQLADLVESQGIKLPGDQSRRLVPSLAKG